MILPNRTCVPMMDGRLVASVGPDVKWLYIDGLSVYVALYWIVGGCHPWFPSLSRGTVILR
jgi:hypothetical protein